MTDRMLDESGVRILLEPFGLQLSPDQIRLILVYLDLLMRWNPNINLTSIRNAEEAVTRHFGESLCLARWAKLQGNLLDIGSGAGFPGLALQIVFPGLTTTLLEPVAKKRAFLKEVARACDFRSVEVRRERLEEFVGGGQGMRFKAITARAVGHFDQLVPEAVKIIDPDGRLYLWVGQQQGNDLRQSSEKVEWDSPFAIPLGREREIWVGRRK
jgi:16S rRNA (guanine527-N7)-methyltransferase